MWIEAPDVCQIVLERKSKETDILFGMISEIHYASEKKMVFPSYNFSTTSSLTNYGNLFLGGVIERSEISALDLHQFFFVMGILGMDFSQSINSEPVGVYLLDVDEEIHTSFLCQESPKIDLIPLAMLVTLPLFPRSATEQQGLQVVEYAKRVKKMDFLRLQRDIKDYMKRPPKWAK